MKIALTARHHLALALLAAAALAWAVSGCDELITEVNQITIAGNPTADFDITDTTRYFCCAPCSVQFVDLSNGPRDGWLWRFGDGDSSTDTLPSHIYDSAGVYTVSLTVTNSETEGLDVEVKKRFLIMGTSAQAISASLDSGCAPLEVDFEPTLVGGETSYSWDFGDGKPLSTLREPTHTYDTAGKYEVALTVEGDCGVAIVRDSIIVADCPEVDFVVSDTVTTTGCEDFEVTFIDVTDTAEHIVVLWYEWDFGDGPKVTVGKDGPLSDFVVHTYATPDVYDVSMTVVASPDSQRITATREAYIIVQDSVNAAFTPTHSGGCMTAGRQFLVAFNTVCDSLCLRDSSLWDFGDGFTDTAANPVHAFIDLGVYEVRHILWGCGVDTFLDTIALSQPLSPTFTISPSDSGDTLTFFDFEDLTTGIVLTREWDFGDNSPAVSQISPTYRYRQPGVFEVRLTLKNSCGTFEAVDTVTVTIP